MQFYQIQEPNTHETTSNENGGCVAVGIDLGTTNSLIAVSRSGKVDIIEIEGNKLLPSIVYYSDGEVFVGSSAKAFSGAINSVKRLIGKSHADISTNTILPHLDITFKEGQIDILAGKRSVSPEEVSAEILKTLKMAAEDSLKIDIRKAVITVPAYFDDAARNATQKAAKIAGLEVLRLINEPTAAAFAYGMQNKAVGTFAVYDLGGGTFDISILRMQYGVLKVIAVAGDLQLGGDDFDIELLNFIISKHKLSMPSSENMSLALNEAKRIKEYLTYHEEWLGTDQDYFQGCCVTRSEFERATEHLLKRTISLFKKALKDADCSTDGSCANLLDAIILVGGSTRMSCIKFELEKEFSVNVLDSFNPDEIVVIGAAIQAEALYRGSDSDLLLDVTPLSLGIEVIGGLVEVIIPRNTPIPIEVNKMFTTSQDNQTIFQLHVLQGESEKVSFCRSLARFELSKIPKMPAGVPRLLITFRVDADGILMVFAEEINTGIKQSVEIRPSYGLSDETLKCLLTSN